MLSKLFITDKSNPNKNLSSDAWSCTFGFWVSQQHFSMNWLRNNFVDNSGSPSLVTITNVWVALKDRKGHLVHVDVKDIVEEEYLDLELIEEEILESIED